MILWNSAANWLSDLLNAPHLQNISFSCGCDDGRQIWFNRQQLVSQQRIGPDETGYYKLSRLLTRLGCNQLVIQVMQTTSEWQFSGKFHDTDRGFLSTLEFGAGRPDGE